MFNELGSLFSDGLSLISGIIQYILNGRELLIFLFLFPLIFVTLRFLKFLIK